MGTAANLCSGRQRSCFTKGTKNEMWSAPRKNEEYLRDADAIVSPFLICRGNLGSINSSVVL